MEPLPLFLPGQLLFSVLVLLSETTFVMYIMSGELYCIVLTVLSRTIEISMASELSVFSNVRFATSLITCSLTGVDNWAIIDNVSTYN